MADWIAEGTAARSRIQRNPVRHLVVTGLLWCSAGKAVKDYNPHSPRFCARCKALANEAIADGTLSPEDVQGWPVRRTEGA